MHRLARGRHAPTGGRILAPGNNVFPFFAGRSMNRDSRKSANREYEKSRHHNDNPTGNYLGVR